MSFKKDLGAGRNSLLSSKDTKTLRSALEELYPQLGGALDTLLPKKAALEATKYGNGAIVYQVQGEKNPILFNPSGKDGDPVFPTVYSIWKCPWMMPTISMYWQVSDKIIKGADLMLPGVIVPPSGDWVPSAKAILA